MHTSLQKGVPENQALHLGCGDQTDSVAVKTRTSVDYLTPWEMIGNEGMPQAGEEGQRVAEKTATLSNEDGDYDKG